MIPSNRLDFPHLAKGTLCALIQELSCESSHRESSHRKASHREASQRESSQRESCQCEAIYREVTYRESSHCESSYLGDTRTGILSWSECDLAAILILTCELGPPPPLKRMHKAIRTELRVRRKESVVLRVRISSRVAPGHCQLAEATLATLQTTPHRHILLQVMLACHSATIG
jgi:hypothetical protein